MSDENTNPNEKTIADRLDEIPVERLSDEEIAELESLAQEIVYVEIDDIKPSANKARNNDLAVPKVASSIRQCGFRSPIFVNGETNEIVIGHTRWAAAKKLGLHRVPVVFIFDLSPSKLKLLKLADNKVAEFSGWDFSELDKELEELRMELPEVDFGDLGFGVFGGDVGGMLPDELAGKDLTPDELPDKGGEVATGGRIIIIFDESRRKEVADFLGVKELPKDAVSYQFDDIVKMRDEAEDAE